jgi:hypothetical protein
MRIELGIGIEYVCHWYHPKRRRAFSVFNPAIFFLIFLFVLVDKVKRVRHDGATHAVRKSKELFIAQLTGSLRIEDFGVLLNDGYNL